MLRWTLTLVVALALASPAQGVGPSKNQGRRGTYRCETGRANCAYFVRVPDSYSETNPAGIHVYIHGDGCRNTAEPYLALFDRFFLEPHNLIGIDMQWSDETNWVDVDGKAAAVMEAVEQTAADYKVIRGRGVIASHCGGANVHWAVVEKYGAAEKPGTWPFCHSAAYAPRYDHGVKSAPEMSWLICAADGEWAGASIGADAVARTRELMARAAEGQCPDVCLRTAKGRQHWKVIRGEGRWLEDGDLAESAAIFARSDLAFCAFLYEPDFTEPELAPIVKTANRLELGAASSALDRLLARKDLTGSLRWKAELVRAKLGLRVASVLDLSRGLSARDPVLWGWYRKVFARQLAGHPGEAELASIPAPTSRQARDAEWAVSQFANRLDQWFSPVGALRAEAVPVLNDIGGRLGSESSFGRMADGFLRMR